MAHDVRAIANWALDLSERQGFALSNISINKVVFFLHANYLANFRRPLVSAKIEAWQFGPVFRELYAAFKHCGSDPISDRIWRLDPVDGQRKLCQAHLAEDELELLTSVCPQYAKLSSAALVALSHEKGSPWDKVWNHDGEVNAFMRISDDEILEWLTKSARH